MLICEIQVPPTSTTVILITVSVLVLLVFVALESSIPQTPSPSSHEVGSPLVREGEGEK